MLPEPPNNDNEGSHIPELARLKELSAELVGPELLARLIEALPDPLIVVNERGQIVMFNGQAELLFGYHRMEVHGQSIEILLPDEVRHQHVRHRDAYMIEPRVRPMGSGQPLTGRHKSGRIFPVQINLSPIVTTTGTYVCAAIRHKRE